MSRGPVHAETRAHRKRCKRALEREPEGYQPPRAGVAIVRLDYREPYWLNYENRMVCDE